MKSVSRTQFNPINRDLLMIVIGTFVLAVTLVTLTVLALLQL